MGLYQSYSSSRKYCKRHKMPRYQSVQISSFILKLLIILTQSIKYCCSAFYETVKMTQIECYDPL